VRRPGSAAIQPQSLAGSVLYQSPLSARSLSLSGRGKLADRGTVYTTKVCGLGVVGVDGLASARLCVGKAGEK
jgi:hypothetical protein